MGRVASLLLAAAALACAPATSPSAAPTAPGGQAVSAFVISGRLARKGPDETSFWAVTDATGRTFELTDVTPELDARFRKLQNGQVTLRVEPTGKKLLLERVHVLQIVQPAP